MKNLLVIHQYILVAALLTLVSQGAFYYFLLRPRQAAHAAAVKELERMQQRLASSNWPRDSEKLQQLLQEYRRQLKGDQQQLGIEQKTAGLLAQASRMYDSRIHQLYGNKNDFYRNVSRLDFQEEFNRLQTHLQSQGIVLESSALNLTEDTLSAYNYQLMLQLWTLETICQRLQDAGLQSGNPLLAKGSGKPAKAQISLLALQAFFREEKAERPFLLEFPVALTVYGTLEQFLSFCQSLYADEVFLALRNVSLTALPPARLQADEQGALENGALRLELVCAGYYQY
jgi:Tfp pilus assembly protein PilO